MQVQERPASHYLVSCTNSTFQYTCICAGDIEQDEELTHTYISLEWRTCFSELNDIVNGKKE